jgi:uncharacterized protein (TIRG00374 family)
MKRVLRGLLGLAVSVFFIALSLRGKHLDAVWVQVRDADYRYLAAYFLVLVAIHVIRTYRWGLLIAPLYKAPWWRLNAVCAVGFMALIVLPFRLGEFARPYLIRVPGKIRGTAAMASVVVERVLDGLMVAAMLVILLLRIPDGPGPIAWVRGGGIAMFLFFFALLAFLIFSYAQERLALRVVRATLGRVAPKLCERLCGLLEAFIGGLRALPSWRMQLWIVLLTAIYWGLNGWGMQTLARGFDIHLDLMQAYTVLGTLVIGVMIPAGPGMAGTFQYFTQLGLSVFFGTAVAFGPSATAYANVLWAAQFTQQVAFGLIFLSSKHLRSGPGHGHRPTFGELIHAEEAIEGESPTGGK